MKYPSNSNRFHKPLFHPVSSIHEGIQMMDSAHKFLLNLRKLNAPTMTNQQIIEHLLVDGYLAKELRNEEQLNEPIYYAFNESLYKTTFDAMYRARTSTYYVNSGTTYSLLLDISNMRSRNRYVTIKWRGTKVSIVGETTLGDLLRISKHKTSIYNDSWYRKIMSCVKRRTFSRMDEPTAADLLTYTSSPTDEIFRKFTHPRWVVDGIITIPPLLFIRTPSSNRLYTPPSPMTRREFADPSYPPRHFVPIVALEDEENEEKEEYTVYIK